LKYNNLGKIYVTDDLNSRVADAEDFITYDKYLDQNIDFLNINTNIPIRVNKDKVIDHNGKRLIDLCKSTGVLIANGRVFNEPGDYTFCSIQGLSSVDYLLLNYADFENITYFEKAEFNEFSDHAPILFTLSRIASDPIDCETISNTEQKNYLGQ
jgi:hypothetical protein